MREAEVLEDLEADAVVALVGAVAEGEVGVDGVQPLVLEGVGPELLDQADAAPFLRQVDQGADPLAADHLERQVELVAAVAAERLEQVAGEARRVHPHQRRGDRVEVAHDDGDRLVARLVLDAVADDPGPGRNASAARPRPGGGPASRGGGGS